MAADTNKSIAKYSPWIYGLWFGLGEWRMCMALHACISNEPIERRRRFLCTYLESLIKIIHAYGSIHFAAFANINAPAIVWRWMRDECIYGGNPFSIQWKIPIRNMMHTDHWAKIIRSCDVVTASWSFIYKTFTAYASALHSIESTTTQLRQCSSFALPNSHYYGWLFLWKFEIDERIFRYEQKMGKTRLRISHEWVLLVCCTTTIYDICYVDRHDEHENQIFRKCPGGKWTEW